MAQWLVLSPHSKKVLGWIPDQGVSAWSSNIPSVCPGTPASSLSQKVCKLEIRLIGHSKFPVGVNVSLAGCLSLTVSPAMNWQLVKGVICVM